MAKAPSAKVTKTSGQGVSRLSYQKGYSLGNKGTGAPAGVKDSDSSSSVKTKSSRGGRPPKSKIDKAGGMNISYGDTYFPTDLKDVKEFGKDFGKTPGFAKLKSRDYKPGKSDAGFLKDRKK